MTMPEGAVPVVNRPYASIGADSLWLNLWHVMLLTCRAQATWQLALTIALAVKTALVAKDITQVLWHIAVLLKGLGVIKIY